MPGILYSPDDFQFVFIKNCHIFILSFIIERSGLFPGMLRALFHPRFFKAPVRRPCGSDFCLIFLDFIFRQAEAEHQKHRGYHQRDSRDHHKGYADALSAVPQRLPRDQSPC